MHDFELLFVFLILGLLLLGLGAVTLGLLFNHDVGDDDAEILEQLNSDCEL